MCLAASGIIISIEGQTAKVDILGNICDINVMLVRPHIGDSVLVHAGCAIDLIKPETQAELDALWNELIHV